MIILITGASHTGKTALAQRLLERYKYPYLSLDHLKMGLIRSANTDLTPMSPDEELTALLWPIAREIIKTALENRQDLILEGCYVPFDWKKDFSPVCRPSWQVPRILRRSAALLTWRSRAPRRSCISCTPRTVCFTGVPAIIPPLAF